MYMHTHTNVARLIIFNLRSVWDADTKTNRVECNIQKLTQHFHDPPRRLTVFSYCFTRMRHISLHVLLLIAQAGLSQLHSN